MHCIRLNVLEAFHPPEICLSYVCLFVRFLHKLNLSWDYHEVTKLSSVKGNEGDATA